MSYRSYIYVIAANEAGPTKLGVSVKPPKRVAQLQTGHPEKLKVFHQEEVNPDLAYFLERNLHKDIGYLRLRGEWFNLSVEAAIGHVQFTLIHYEPSDLIP